MIDILDIETLPWSSDRNALIDGARYLVDMKHGIIAGTWRADEEMFGGYYWRDVEWYGSRWVRIG